MKKYILFVFILFAANAAFSQQYLNRHSYANRDTLRTQFKMALIDVAAERIDTATNNSLRLASDILANPNDTRWLDMFMFQAVVTLSSATPTDAQVKALVAALWRRSAALNTRR